jgi:hypothetical protein
MLTKTYPGQECHFIEKQAPCSLPASSPKHGSPRLIPNKQMTPPSPLSQLVKNTTRCSSRDRINVHAGPQHCGVRGSEMSRNPCYIRHYRTPPCMVCPGRSSMLFVPCSFGAKPQQKADPEYINPRLLLKELLSQTPINDAERLQFNDAFLSLGSSRAPGSHRCRQ